MVIAQGDKLHIITRRLFESDLRRHFAGIVEEVSGTLIKIRGYVFVFDESDNQFVRRDEERTRIFSVSDSGLIINIIPAESDLPRLQYEIDARGRRMLTDGKAFALNVTEFGAIR